MKKLLCLLLLAGGLGSTVSFTTVHASHTSEKSIKLYVYNNCPYCKNVVNYLKKHGALDKIVVVSADKNPEYTMLQQLSGSTQCPFLHDEVNNVKMLESKSIMNYFKNLFNLPS